MNLRTARSVEDFVGMAGDPDGYAETVADMWASGESRPDWSFILEDGGERLGRIAYRVDETCQPEFLGDLPSHELFVYGWWLPWEHDPRHAGTTLVSRSVEQLPEDLPNVVQLRLNAAFHAHVGVRVQVAEASGFELFQEKEGVLWEDDGVPVQVSDRLRFHPVSEVGREAYRSVLGSAGRGTLDRNDRYYYRLAGEQNWSNVFMSFLGPDDEDMWLLGSFPDGTPVGFVGVSPFDEPDVATIAFVGVAPEHRGHRYIDDLLTAGNAVAQRRGFRSVLSDVDTVNAPMLAAMERNGHHADRHPWHVWHYRMAR
jgi:RimJ/RimL family protein N-acetyltransferase